MSTEKTDLKTTPASAGSECSAAPDVWDVSLIIALHIMMIGMVWWFDWRLLVAWACKGAIDDMRREHRERKRQNGESSEPGAKKKD